MRRSLNSSSGQGVASACINAAWNGTIYDIGAVCAFNVRQYQDALEWVQEALSMDPDNERLKNNLLLIQRHRG
jgi:tetratricopeptide (TPR) repeat protein